MKYNKNTLIKAALVAFVVTSLISVYKVNKERTEQENLAKLMEINQQLAERNAQAIKLNKLEDVLLNGDATSVIPEFLTLADAGSTRAQFALGWAYREGLGVDQNYEAALEWFLKAAASKNIEKDGDAQSATYYIGEIYLKGMGTVEADELMAKEWLLKAQSFRIKEADVLLNEIP